MNTTAAMAEPKAKKQMENVLEDMLWCAGQMQKDPAKFTRAFQDKDTRDEFRRLIGDMFSLVEVISGDAE